MTLTYKYRIYPTKAQTAFLEGELREACSLYNAALEERIGAWKVCRKSLNYYGQCSQLRVMREDGCLTLANAQTSQDVLHRVDRAFKAFFARCKRGDKPGFPRYRSCRRYDSITYPQYPSGCRMLPTGKLLIQGAGHVSIKLHRPLTGRVKTATIKREADRWYVYFSAECDTQTLQASAAEIGIDVGLNNFAVLSDGREVRNPRHHRNAEARLRCAQRKVSRRKNKKSIRRRKAVRLLQRAHAYIANQRADFHHQLSRQLVNEFGLIAVEDLNIKGLAGGMLSKSVNDAGWAQFLRFLDYKAESAGRRVVKVDPRGTSQTCICGESVPKGLSDRWHDCPQCGASVSRDHMSAMVILSRAGNRPSGANVEEVISCVA